MNLFEFKAAMSYAKDVTTIKEIEELLRASKCIAGYWEVRGLKDDELVLEYRYSAYLVHLFNSKSSRLLPSYITGNMADICKRITGKKVNSSSKATQFTYEEYLETFKYTEKVFHDHNAYTAVFGLAKIVGSNTKYYNHLFNTYTDSFTNAVTGGRLVNKILTLEMWKLENKAKNLTVIEDLLTEYYREYEEYKARTNSKPDEVETLSKAKLLVKTLKLIDSKSALV